METNIKLAAPFVLDDLCAGRQFSVEVHVDLESFPRDDFRSASIDDNDVIARFNRHRRIARGVNQRIALPLENVHLEETVCTFCCFLYI